MKKVIRKRTKRMKNGTTMWRLTTMNIKTGRTTSRTVRGTYDEITAIVHRVRSRNPYNAVCADELHKWGGKVKENGRAVALDSIKDEEMFDEVIRNVESADENDPFYFDSDR